MEGLRASRPFVWKMSGSWWRAPSTESFACAGYRWIAETLNMGVPSSVRAYLARLE
jgi:hypothetical protein